MIKRLQKIWNKVELLKTEKSKFSEEYGGGWCDAIEKVESILKFAIEQTKHTRYFQYNRPNFADSISTGREVEDFEEVKDIIESDAFCEGFYKNIRIGDAFNDIRYKPYDWGDEIYCVLSDVAGIDGQCVGFVNFKE